MADLPWYTTDLARSSALEAQRLSDLATKGSHNSAGHFEPDPDSQGGQRFVNEPGTQVTTDANGVRHWTTVKETAPSSMGMLGNAATAGNQQLNPGSNSFLMGAGEFARSAAGGGMARTYGQDRAYAGIDAATAGAQGIGAAGTQNAGNQQQVFGQAGQDLNAVRASAQGMGPSAAEHLARSQLDSNIRAQSSLAATARGGNIASAMRGAQNAGQNMMLQSQQQMAAQRAQEQMNAQGLLTQGNQGLAGMASTGRGQDINQATGMAAGLAGAGQLGNQAYGTNASLGQFGIGAMNNSGALYGTQMGQMTQADQNSRQAYADWMQRQQQIAMGIPVQVGGQMGQVAIANDQAAQQREAAAWSAVGTGVAALGQFAH